MASTSTRTEIEGWGADLDMSNRPAVPMERTPPRKDVPWDKPATQPQRIPVFVSIEYPERPPVFGTSAPPVALSGVIRRSAFNLSENDIRHWLMLILADRVNMVEGIIDDLRRGHIPNIFAEMGWKAKFKYNRAAAIGKVLTIAAIIGGGIYLLMRDKDEE